MSSGNSSEPRISRRRTMRASFTTQRRMAKKGPQKYQLVFLFEPFDSNFAGLEFDCSKVGWNSIRIQIDWSRIKLIKPFEPFDPIRFEIIRTIRAIRAIRAIQAHSSHSSQTSHSVLPHSTSYCFALFDFFCDIQYYIS